MALILSRSKYFNGLFCCVSH